MKANDMLITFREKEQFESYAIACKTVIVNLIDESKELMKKRSSKSDATLLSILRELNDKYNAFVRLEGTERLIKDGFKIYLKSIGIDIELQIVKTKNFLFDSVYLK